MTVECPCGSTLKLVAEDVQYNEWIERVKTFDSIWGSRHHEYALKTFSAYRFKCPVCKKRVRLSEDDLPSSVRCLAERSS